MSTRLYCVGYICILHSAATTVFHCFGNKYIAIALSDYFSLLCSGVKDVMSWINAQYIVHFIGVVTGCWV